MHNFYLDVCYELVNIEMLGARLKAWIIFWEMLNHVKIIHAIRIENDVKYR